MNGYCILVFIVLVCVCVCVCFAAGETERVIDLYSKGATYLQNGISVVIAVDGETNVTSS